MSKLSMNEYFILEKLNKDMYVLWSSPSKQKYLGDICFDISAGWVYITDEDNEGYLTSEFLRAIADRLDELNAKLFKEFPDVKV